LCPGLTATEFHLTQGQDPVTGDVARVHDDGGTPVEDVVTASLRALETGEVVCVPGLVDGEAVDRIAAAEAGLRSSSTSTLAPRYQNPAHQ
jgi:short-subunit dehydrogenase